MAGSSELSKTQIDRLGDRLRKGNIQQDDLRLLDIYRRSFTISDVIDPRVKYGGVEIQSLSGTAEMIANAEANERFFINASSMSVHVHDESRAENIKRKLREYQVLVIREKQIIVESIVQVRKVLEEFEK